MALSAIPKLRADPAQPPDRQVASALGWCLVASGDDHIRELLVAAASGGGWQVRSCSTPEQAVREAVLHRVPLALIDVGSIEDRTRYVDAMRMVRGSSDGLLVVCDKVSNADGELWARQEGAWVYLSGITSASDVAAVCLQARQLTEAKLNFSSA